MLITEAHAQGVETAIKAGESLLSQGVLGALCVLLGFAVLGLYLEVRKADKRVSDLIERVVSVAEASKAAAEDTEDALKEMRTTLASLTVAIQTLAREIEGGSRELRHGLSNLLASVRGIARRLNAAPEVPGGDE